MAKISKSLSYFKQRIISGFIGSVFCALLGIVFIIICILNIYGSASFVAFGAGIIFLISSVIIYKYTLNAKNIADNEEKEILDKDEKIAELEKQLKDLKNTKNK